MNKEDKKQPKSNSLQAFALKKVVKQFVKPHLEPALKSLISEKQKLALAENEEAVILLREKNGEIQAMAPVFRDGIINRYIPLDGKIEAVNLSELITNYLK